MTYKDKLWHFGLALFLQFIGVALPFPVIYSTMLIIGLAVGYEICQWEKQIKDKNLNKWFILDSFLDLVSDGFGIGAVYIIFGVVL